jgi:hypothetical protein
MEKAVVDLLRPEQIREATASWDAEGTEPQLISEVVAEFRRSGEPTARSPAGSH